MVHDLQIVYEEAVRIVKCVISTKFELNIADENPQIKFFCCAVYCLKTFSIFVKDLCFCSIIALMLYGGEDFSSYP